MKTKLSAILSILNHLMKILEYRMPGGVIYVSFCIDDHFDFAASNHLTYLLETIGCSRREGLAKFASVDCKIYKRLAAVVFGTAYTHENCPASAVRCRVIRVDA